MKVSLHTVGITVGAATTGFFLTVPDAAMQVWNASPELIKTIVPEDYIPLVTGTLTFLTVVSKFIRSKKEKK